MFVNFLIYGYLTYLFVEQPLEKNNKSSVEGKEPISIDTCTSNTTTVPEDITSPPRLVIPPNRDGAISPTGPAHQPPVSPLHQKPNSPGKVNFHYEWTNFEMLFLSNFLFLVFFFFLFQQKSPIVRRTV